MTSKFGDNITIRMRFSNNEYEEWVVIDTLHREQKQYLVVVPKEQYTQEQDASAEMDFVEVVKHSDGKREMSFVDENQYSTLHDYYKEHDEEQDIAYENEANRLDEIVSESIAIKDEWYHCFTGKEGKQLWIILDTILYHKRKFHLCVPVVSHGNSYQLKTDTVNHNPVKYDITLMEVMNFQHKNESPEFDKSWTNVTEHKIYRHLYGKIDAKMKELVSQMGT